MSPPLPAVPKRVPKVMIGPLITLKRADGKCVGGLSDLNPKQFRSQSFISFITVQTNQYRRI